jgi:3-deoxy-D-manno-octulosonic-acid transferase
VSTLLLYNTLIALLGLIAAPFALVACLVLPHWRRGLAARLGLGWPRLAGRGALWAHGASVGEVEGIAPLVRRWREAYPGAPIVVSALTATGCDAARRLIPEAEVLTFPLDLPLLASSVVRRLRPRLFLFSENELWPNAISALHRSGVPIVQVSGRLSPRAARTLARVPRLSSAVLSRVTRFCVQGDEHRARLEGLGVPASQIVVTGSLKGDDRVPAVPPFLPILESDGRPVVVGASTHEGEEEIVLDAQRVLRERGLRPLLLLAPRHPERFAAVAGLLARRGERFVRRSELPSAVAEAAARLSGCDVLLLDTLGELAGCYPVAAVAFVGGTLVPIGGHNVLEAARCGTPIVLGPHVDSIAALAMRLEATGAAIVVKQKTATALAAALAEQLEPERAAHARRAGLAVAASEGGGLGRTWSAIEVVLGREPAGARESAPAARDAVAEELR